VIEHAPEPWTTPSCGVVPDHSAIAWMAVTADGLTPHWFLAAAS